LTCGAADVVACQGEQIIDLGTQGNKWFELGLINKENKQVSMRSASNNTRA
jgi:hypothetical protein